MNFNIVPRQFDGETIQTVNARELHETLGIGRDFSTWIKSRIDQYGFAENNDYVVFTNSGEKAFDSPELVNQKSGRGGDRRSIDYHVSLDMAKELAMVENNDQGRAARRYFIECERRMKAQAPALAGSPPLAGDIYAIGAIADVTRASESSRLGMVRNFVEANAPRLLSALPAYAIDAPIVAGSETAQSSEPTTTITNIARSVGMPPALANVQLECAGLLEKLERKGSKGLPKYYWSVTSKGMAYGKNITSPNNPRETQPHWYVSKSSEIAEIISKGFV